MKCRDGPFRYLGVHIPAGAKAGVEAGLCSGFEQSWEASVGGVVRSRWAKSDERSRDLVCVGS